MKQEPAFPQENPLYIGLTLRDYFAAKAMQAIISKIPVSSSDDSNYPIAVSAGAYGYADAMMEARK